MTFIRLPHLAIAAAYERDVRQRNFPKLIESGRIARAVAEAEIAAWRAIADLMEQGWTQSAVTWTGLHNYTARCLQALESDLDKAKGGEATKLQRLFERRATVDAIHQVIARQKYLIDDTNVLLRQRAEQGRAAA